MAINRYYSAIAQDTTLTGTTTSSTNPITVGATTGFPSSYPFTLAIDYGSSSEELVSVTAVAGLSLTVTRGFNGTTAVSHAIGAVVRHVISAQDLTEMQAHLGSTTGAHGVTGAVVGTTDTQTLSAKTLSGATLTGTLTAGGGVGTSGQVLSSTVTGVQWSSAAAGDVTLTGTQTLTNKTLTDAKINLALNAQTGTTYTFVLTDNAKLVTASNAAAQTYSIPTNASVAFPVGAQINLIQIGAGQVTVQAVTSGTTTVLSAGATAAAPKARVQYSALTCIKVATDTWYVIGDIA